MDGTRRTEIHEHMVRFADGDRGAFEPLLQLLWPVVLAFAQRGLGNANDAEDVAQEVFVRLCSRIAEFDRARDGVSWVFGIAAYEIMTQRKRVARRREGTADGLELRADADVLPDERVIGEQLQHALTLAVGELTLEDRAVLGLRGRAGSSDGRIAGATMRKRRQRALERVRSVWRSLYGGL